MKKGQERMQLEIKCGRNAKKAKPVSKQLVQNHDKLHKELDNGIRIVESVNTHKIPVARVCSEWLGSVSRDWVDNGSWINIRRLTDYVKESFTEHDWTDISRQRAFNLVSLSAGVAIEIKSMTVGNTRMHSNATIYPTRVKAGDVLPKHYDYPEGYSAKTRLDVLVLCVNRSNTNKVDDFAVVDGSYWGFTYRDYRQCKKLYSNLNAQKFKNKVWGAYKAMYGDDFVDKLAFGRFGNSLDLNFRKLITLTNPVGRLHKAGWWKVSEGK
jgi:hypothetical protein